MLRGCPEKENPLSYEVQGLQKERASFIQNPHAMQDKVATKLSTSWWRKG